MKPASYNQCGSLWREFSCFVPCVELLFIHPSVRGHFLFFFREAWGKKAGGNSVSLMTHVPVSVSQQNSLEQCSQGGQPYLVGPDC